MRRLFLTTFIAAISGAAMADSFNLTSAVSHVTVYPQGATVVREVVLDLPTGQHQLYITDIPEGLVAESLRIFGAEGLVIGATGFHYDRLPPDDREIAERKAIEDLIEAMRDTMRTKQNERQAIELEVDAANARIAFLEAMGGRQAVGSAAGIDSGAVSTETLQQMVALVGSETLKALQDAHDARLRMAAIEREFGELQDDLKRLLQQLDAAALPPSDRVIVSLDVSAAAAMSGALQISYMVDYGTGWAPVYDLHLDQASAELRLVRKAMIAQDTGEAWDGVAMTLSTARPNMQLDPGELYAQRANLYEPYVASEVRADGAVLMAAPAAPVVMVEEEAAFSGAQFAMQGLTAVYHLPDPVTLDGDGAPTLFVIDEQTFDAELTARATPLLDENAFLFAGITNTTAAPYLPGTASFYRDGAFIGSSEYFEMIAAGESADLAFGAIDGIKTERVTLFRESGQSGILTSSNDKIEQYELRVENLTSQAWDVILYDRAPYSEEEDLEIEVKANPVPTVSDVDGKRGVFGWEFELAAGASKSVAFEFSLAWPRDLEVEY